MAIEKTLSKEQVRNVLDSLPAGSSKEEAVNKLIKSGYKLEGFGQAKPTTPAVTAQEPQRMLTPNDVMKGQFKGVGSTLLGAAQLGQRGLAAITGVKPVGGQEQLTQNINQTRETYLAPKNIAEKAGFFGEQAAELAIPTPTKLGQAAKALPFVAGLAERAPTLTRALGFLGTGLREGVETAGISALQSGSTEGAGTNFAIGAILPASLRAAGSLATQTAKALSSRLGGYPAAALEEAFRNPQKVSQAIKTAVSQGEAAPLSVLRNADEALKEVKTARNQAYEASLKEVEDSLFQNKDGKWYVKKILGKEDVKDMTPSGAAKALGKEAYVPINVSTKGVKDLTTSVLGDFNVKGSRGKFDFFESRLRPKEKDVNEIIDTVYQWEDISPTGLNRLRQIVGDYKITNPSVTSDRQFNAFVESLSKNIDNYLADRVPQIREMNRAYASETQFIESLSDEILNPNAKESTRITKLMNVFKANNPLSTQLVKTLGEKTGMDIKADIAGVLLSRLAPEGLLGTIGANAVTTGALINPATLAAIPFFSPRVAGAVATGAGRAKDAIEGSINLGLPLLRGAISNVLRPNQGQ